MIDIQTEFSNKYCFADSSTRLFYRITLKGKINSESLKNSPSQSYSSGNWLIFVIDRSSSMVGEKIETAKEAAITTIKNLKKGNYISIYTFSDDVEILVDHESVSDIDRFRNLINEIRANGRTSLHKTLVTLINNAKDYAIDAGSVSVLFLTDGQPTDITDLSKYEPLAGMAAEYGIRINMIGIGSDYNEDIIKRISDITNGEFYHVADRSELSTIFGDYADHINKTIANSVVMSVTLKEAKEFKSYDQNFIQQGNQYLLNVGSVTEEPFFITGHIIVPPGNNGEVPLLSISVDYRDMDGSPKSINQVLNVERTNDMQKIVSNTNQEIVNAARVKMNIERFEYLASIGDVSGATKAISEARKAAEATKNIKLIESTKKLESMVSSTQTGKIDKKQIYNETSRIKRKGD